MNILVFDIWADFGQYKKFYTTSSPLTFSIPPVTALNGLVGAFLGWSKVDNTYIDKANKAGLRYAVSIKGQIKKSRMGLNIIETKKAGKMFNNIQQRTQVKAEFLYHPNYRILLTASNQDVLEKLTDIIASHQSIYTPYLGITECLAEFKYISSYKGIPSLADDYIDVASVIPVAAVKKIKFENKKKYLRERIPVAMDNDRKVTRYEEVYLEADGKPIKVLLKNSIVNINDQNYVFVN